jgi:regulation of enolase protein 1 (concanavalin A-like superfamily)
MPAFQYTQNTQEKRVRLRKILDKRFNEEEFRELCFHLSMNYEDLGGRGKSAKARELVDYCARHGYLEHLDTLVQQLLPPAPPQPAVPPPSPPSRPWLTAVFSGLTIVLVACVGIAGGAYALKVWLDKPTSSPGVNGDNDDNGDSLIPSLPGTNGSDNGGNTERAEGAAISFAAPDNPTSLNPDLSWQRGGSNANNYDLERTPGSLTLVAGAYTSQGRSLTETSLDPPMITYPVQGDFTAQVRVTVSCPSSKYIMFPSTGIGIRPLNSSQIDPLFRNWLRMTLNCDPFSQQTFVEVLERYIETTSLATNQVNENTIYLKMSRQRSLFTLAYGSDGNRWTTLKRDYVFDVPSNAEIYLLVQAGSESRQGFFAELSDFRVEEE